MIEPEEITISTRSYDTFYDFSEEETVNLTPINDSALVSEVSDVPPLPQNRASGTELIVVVNGVPQTVRFLT